MRVERVAENDFGIVLDDRFSIQSILVVKNQQLLLGKSNIIFI